MDDRVSASYSVLSTQVLQQILQSEYALKKIDTVIFFQAGLNDTYLVKQQSTQYVLRIYRKNWRSLADISYEIDALLYLKKKAVNVAGPIVRLDNKFISSVNAAEGLRYFVLFEYIPGDKLSFFVNNMPDNQFAHNKGIDNKEIVNKLAVFNYAQSMAHMHQVMQKFDSPHQRILLDINHLLMQPLQLIKKFIAHRPDDCAYLEELALLILDSYKKQLVSELSYGFCHGDLNGDNAHLFTNKLTLFDFDCCGEGYLAYDLAVFLWAARIDKNENRLWNDFLQAYQKINPLTPADLLLIPLFVLMRHFWHMALHISLSKDRGCSGLDDRYFDRQMIFLKDCQCEYLEVDCLPSFKADKLCL